MKLIRHNGWKIIIIAKLAFKFTYKSYEFNPVTKEEQQTKNKKEKKNSVGTQNIEMAIQINYTKWIYNDWR